MGGEMALLRNRLFAAAIIGVLASAGSAPARTVQTMS